MGRVGVLMGYPESDPGAQVQVAAFRQELRGLGWEEGRNAQIDVRKLTQLHQHFLLKRS
jgi:hypothetical protein